MNKENIRKLKEIMQSKGRFAVFVGAGASKLLGIKTWDQVLEEMAREFDAPINVAQKIMEVGYAKTASEIYKIKNDPDLYRRFMSKQFIPEGAYHYSLHIKIINVFDVLITTNYDTSFESAFGDLNNHLIKCGHSARKYSVQKLPDFTLSEILTSPTLIYLHGNNDDELYVFREEEYQTYYPSNYLKDENSRLEDLLKLVFKEFTLVFIGFSFNDADFVKFYKNYRIKEIKFSEKFKRTSGKTYQSGELPQNFIILSEDKLLPKIEKSKILGLFKEDESWEQVFVDGKADMLIFKENADDIIRQAIRGEEKQKYLLDEFSKSKLYLIKELQLRPITFSGNDYKQIENILEAISTPETVVKDISEAAYAE